MDFKTRGWFIYGGLGFPGKSEYAYRSHRNLPLFLLLAISLDWGTNGIWWGIFLVNWSAAIFTFFYTRRQIQKMLILTKD